MHRRSPSGLALTGMAAIWAATIVAGPVALAGGSPPVARGAALVYEAAARICHQRPERSFLTGGVQQPVCARCAGLYLSGALGGLVATSVPRRRTFLRHSRTLFAVVAVPTAVTAGLEFLGVAHPSNAVRAVCALPLGALAGWVFVAMLNAEGEPDSAEGAPR